MDLLLVPVALAIGAAFFTWVTNRREREAEELRAIEQREIEDRRAREQALQAYLDRRTDLIRGGLCDSKVGDADQSIARARTLTVLRQLDGMGKGLMLRFLYESELIGKLTGPEGEGPRKEVIVVLVGANLQGANLEGAYLKGADLKGADLRGANLRAANLVGVTLVNAQLGGAHLGGAHLVRSILFGANLAEANLRSANLEGAQLGGATVTDRQLAQAKSLAGATLPDGTVHE
jgi:hypothetical protein